MNLYEDRFEVRFSVDSAELKASKQLRYKVFIEEMGGKIKEGKIESKIEEDQFDQYCKHLLIIDHEKKFGNSRGNIVGIRAENPDELDEKIQEMINIDRPVIFDCHVDQVENCFPMIPSGKPHNQMLLGPKDQKENKITGKGKALV